MDDAPQAKPTVTTDPPAVVEPADGAQGVSRAAVRGAAWMGLATWVNQALSLATFVVLGRLLSPDDFGLVAAASVVLWILRALVDQGFNQVLVQRPNLTEEQIDTAFWTALVTGVAIAVLTAAAAPLVASMYSQPGLTRILQALSVVFVFVALDSTQSALLAREMKFRVLALRRLVASVASAAIAIVLATSGSGAWALVAQTVAFEGFSVVLLWSLVSWRPSRRFSRTAFRELFNFGARMTVIRTLTNLGANADNILIGIFIGPVALGYYVVAFRVLVVINTLIALALTQVVLSAFSRLQHDLVALRAAFYRSGKIAAGISIPVYAGLALVAYPLTVLLFGSKWSPSVPVMQALVLAGVVQCQLIFTTQYAIALNRVGNELKWTACLIAAELVAFAIAVSFGIVAVALSLGIVLIIAWPIRLRRLGEWGGIRLRDYFRPYPRLILATAAMAGAVLGVGWILTGAGGATELVAQIVTGILVYTAGLAVFARDELYELREWITQMRSA